MLLHLCIVSLTNIGAGFALGIVLGRRYRKVASRRLGAAFTFDLASNLHDPVSEAPVSAMVQSTEPLPKGTGHLAIDDLNDRAAQFGEQLFAADEQLRQCAASPDLGKIESVLQGIESTARKYAESRKASNERLADAMRGDANWEKINSELQVATQMQDATIQAACREIASFDYESSLSEGCQKIVGHTHQLLNSNDVLRDSLQKALAEVAQRENRPPDEADCNDPLTGCLNRTGIEAELNARWSSVADRGRLGVASIDIDRLSETNEQFGYGVGNEILKATARLIEKSCSDNFRVARFSGQRFLVAFSGIDSMTLIENVERCRQTIDKAHFDHNDFDIHITVSCSVTRASDEDSLASLLARSEGALNEAKRYGQNRTFVHEGKFPTPVVAPELDVEELHFPV